MIERHVFKIGEKEIDLTHEEAQQLFKDLGIMFGEKKDSTLDRYKELHELLKRPAVVPNYPVYPPIPMGDWRKKEFPLPIVWCGDLMETVGSISAMPKTRAA